MTDKKIQILQKIQDGRDLPSLSPVTVRLIEAASENSISVSDIVGIIQQDPSLTTRLLKMVNSPYFGVRQPVKTLLHAVTYLGLKRVRLAALSLSLKQTFQLESHKGFDYDQFWRMSLYRAVMARGLCLDAGIKELDPEEAFVAGLILEIGQLMMFEAMDVDQRRSYPHQTLSIAELLRWETENLGVNHREVGRLILKRWRFPPSMVETQQWDGESALSNDSLWSCRITELAHRGAEILFSRSEELFPYHRRVKEVLGLPSGQVNEVLGRALVEVDELAGALEMEARSGKDVLTVMEKANQALSRLNGSLEKHVRWFLEHQAPSNSFGKEFEDRAVEEEGKTVEAALQAVAHEIRNPLTSLSGFVRRLSKTLPSDEKNSKYMEIILGEAARLERVMDELSRYSRTYTPEFGEHDLGQVVLSVIDQVRTRFKERNIEIRLDMDRSVPRMRFDAPGIAEVLLRFLVNSARSMDRGGPLTVTAHYETQARVVKLVILDSGKPFPEEALNELMDPIMMSRTFGAGLGIPMAKKILASHGGDVHLTRWNEGGNRAEISLPVQPVRDGR
ncbi:MAG: HDOD domain-containing protein [Deltaproteobacteria bacterium]|nr:HDOD domain-containing protein [Deltaproteobacteria bacterium]